MQILPYCGSFQCAIEQLSYKKQGVCQFIYAALLRNNLLGSVDISRFVGWVERLDVNPYQVQ